MNRLVIGADHHGFVLKEFLLRQRIIGDVSVQWIDVGTDQATPTDYPKYAFKAVKKFLAKEADGAVLLCGSGIGMCMAANRFKHVYAALVWNAEIAKRAKQEDDANVLVLPADYLEQREVITILASWLNAKFLDGHYQARLRELDMF